MQPNSFLLSIFRSNFFIRFVLSDQYYYGRDNLNKKRIFFTNLWLLSLSGVFAFYVDNCLFSCSKKVHCLTLKIVLRACDKCPSNARFNTDLGWTIQWILLEKSINIYLMISIEFSKEGWRTFATCRKLHVSLKSNPISALTYQMQCSISVFSYKV